jgi:hypothetical protein
VEFEPHRQPAGRGITYGHYSDWSTQVASMWTRWLRIRAEAEDCIVESSLERTVGADPHGTPA